jgi:hypothetical protein
VSPLNLASVGESFMGSEAMVRRATSLSRFPIWGTKDLIFSGGCADSVGC